jgi:hypothetical protein
VIVADCDHLATFRTDVPGGHQTCLKCGTEFCFWLPRPVVPDEVLRQLASDIRAGWSRMAADPLYRFYGGEDTPQARDEHFQRRAAEITKWNPLATTPSWTGCASSSGTGSKRASLV